MVCLGRPHHFKIFKDCLPQILLGPFLNTLTYIYREREISSMKWVNRISENVKYPVPKLKWNMKLLKLMKYNCKTKDFHTKAAAFQFHWLHLFGTVRVLDLQAKCQRLTDDW